MERKESRREGEGGGERKEEEEAGGLLFAFRLAPSDRRATDPLGSHY